jgi:hypothetical protein
LEEGYDCNPIDEAEDTYYRQYVMQLRQLDGAAKKAGFAPRVMELDWFLMCEAYRLFPPKSQALYVHALAPGAIRLAVRQISSRHDGRAARFNEKARRQSTSFCN